VEPLPPGPSIMEVLDYDLENEEDLNIFFSSKIRYENMEFFDGF
jgi:hypothetical protein